jgi:hypothetical protein
VALDRLFNPKKNSDRRPFGQEIKRMPILATIKDFRMYPLESFFRWF